MDTQLVKIAPKVEIFVPNTFTPNHDGTNDVLRPFMIGIKSLTYFRVFNRWGQQVFETHTANAGWDGKFKGVLIEIQTVVWMVEAVGADNVLYRKKGSSILVR